MRITSLALALTVLSAGGAGANDSIRENQAHSLDLGDIRGIAYYTAEPGGLRVVATLAAGETATPLRFVATLADGQRMTISTPGGAGVETSVDIVRSGSHLVVDPTGIGVSD